MSAPTFIPQDAALDDDVLGPPRGHSITRDRHLTIDEVADILRCSKRTVAELVRTHRIPHMRPPYMNRVLFPPAWLARWLNGEWELTTEYTTGGGRIVRPPVRAGMEKAR
jgi:excisionase family DNA binding protein